jgi:ribonuclease T2
MEMPMSRVVCGMMLGVALSLVGCKAQVSDGSSALQPVSQPSDAPRYQQEPRQEGGRSRRARPHENAVPGAFDFYLLTLSWSPEFCVTHPQAAECAASPGFILHGLWPQNTDGSYPEHCADTPGPQNESVYRDIFADTHLLEHEWQTHGTCSGLSAEAYFNTARQALRSVKIPRELASVQASLQLTPGQILGDFAQANPGMSADSFALSCGNNRLTAVEVCLTKDLHATSCSSVRSCRANVVKVTPPGATSDE